MTMRSAEESASPPSYARIGEVLAGKYRIERVLGRGGMGIVVAASHVKLRQTVAIKFLLPSTLAEPELAKRLLREARAAAALKGKHVARVFDVDAIDGAPYIVMEYFEGRTLAAHLDASGPLSATLTVDYALEACEALAEAHALGIVHRDLKPSNLFLARTPGGRQTLRVLDFGISKALDGERDDSALLTSKLPEGERAGTLSGTDSHTLVGSPPYVSPEQLLRPREADARSDIWSLGVVLYQCLSGRLPFQGDTLTRLWDSILREPMPALGAAESDVPAELARIVRRCLEKDPKLRYSDVRELARDLAPLGSIRARSSLDAIEGLVTDAPSASPEARKPPENVAPAHEHDRTLTEAPTTRERTPDEVLPLSSFTPFRGRAAFVVAGALAAGGAFLWLRQRPLQETASRAADLTPGRAQAAEATSRIQPIPEAPVARAAPAADSGGERVPHTDPLGTRSRVTTAKRVVTDLEASPRIEPSPRVAPSAAKPPETTALSRAEELLGSGRISEACAVGEVALGSAPASPSVLEFLGRCYMRLGSVDQARSYYRRFLELAPNSPNAAFVRAMLEPRPP